MESTISTDEQIFAFFFFYKSEYVFAEEKR